MLLHLSTDSIIKRKGEEDFQEVATTSWEYSRYCGVGVEKAPFSVPCGTDRAKGATYGLKVSKAEDEISEGIAKWGHLLIESQFMSFHKSVCRLSIHLAPLQCHNFSYLNILDIYGYLHTCFINPIYVDRNNYENVMLKDFQGTTTI